MMRLLCFELEVLFELSANCLIGWFRGWCHAQCCPWIQYGDSISPEARERTQMAAFLYWATACNHLKGHIVHMHYGELQTAYLPPLLLFSGASAAFGAYAVPKFAQLTVTSYYAASSASHYAISQITRYVEGANSSHDHHDKPR
ncbi:uncharacterized protein [Elaeis guineensis]|uniref:uncharacterized protein isoform X3 n=1 Tax=Elaeis guineensis var. tenera TaxID=51953 RepID=UPI003C6CC705